MCQSQLQTKFLKDQGVHVKDFKIGIRLSDLVSNQETRNNDARNGTKAILKKN